jgi:hypothetical protein
MKAYNPLHLFCMLIASKNIFKPSLLDKNQKGVITAMLGAGCDNQNVLLHQ